MVQKKKLNDFDTRQLVLDAVHELYASHQLATRQLISDVLGIKQSLIDDSLKVLCDDGKIKRVERGGVYSRGSVSYTKADVADDIA